MDENSDWKKKVGFPINYDSDSNDEFDTKDVVFRNPQSSSRYLLADGGDGSEADLLGTTPPRARIRNKEKRRNYLDAGGGTVQRATKDKDVVDHAAAEHSERLRRRPNQKYLRAKERDWKLDMSQQNKADSLPSPNPISQPAVPTLVESCSRFMSLTSRPKCRDAIECDELEPEERWREHHELPASRVNFHKTFSMLINMGNVEKGCRRTISREEQVWQNELKDLIWLELQAKIAGRTLAQQDGYLCAQRKIVPSVINNIMEYKFENNNPCRRRINGDGEEIDGDETAEINEQGCIHFNCETCADTVGRAMREVSTLLDAYFSAVSLYPSTKAMTVDHPLVATPTFKDRLKALCLWFNTSLNMRLKMLAIRGFIRSFRDKPQRDRRRRNSRKSESLREPTDPSNRKSQVRFDVSSDNPTPTPTDSSNSESSHKEREEGLHSETTSTGEDGEDCKRSDAGGVKQVSEMGEVVEQEIETADQEEKQQSEADEQVAKQETAYQDGKQEIETADQEEKEENKIAAEEKVGDNNSSGDTRNTNPTTPEIVIDSQYSSVNTADTTESGYTSGVEVNCDGTAKRYGLDPFNIGSFEDVTKFRLLDKNNAPMFRNYYQKSLKTQGVRRSMLFLSTLRQKLLRKVCLALEKPDTVPVTHISDPSKTYQDYEDEPESYQLKRYGAWSAECIEMKLPSYRSHFLLLNAYCLEAMHEYLELRLDATPETPSCLTVKQLIHDLKEALDMSTELRVEFVRNADVSLSGRNDAAPHLLRIIRTYDETIETVLKLYLCYLSTMSAKEAQSRGALQAEWVFSHTLARRMRNTADLAIEAFTQIACNQLNRLEKQFNEDFERMIAEREYESANNESDLDEAEKQKIGVLSICRTAQRIYARGRTQALGAAAWARTLAAKLDARQHLHYREMIFNSLMAICDFISHQVEFVLMKSDQSFREDNGVNDVAATRIRELLLQISKLGFELHRELYQMAVGPLPAGTERASRPVSLQAPRPPRAHAPRPGTMIVHDAFNPVLHQLPIHKELHQLVHDGRGSPPRPARSASRARVAYSRTNSMLDETDATDDRLMELGDTTTHTKFEQLLTEAQSDEEVELRHPQRETRRDQQQEWAAKVARAVIEFAKRWMRFVLERCDRGRGLRPRWASQGLEFLMLACDPCNTKHLSDEEFEELKQLMDGCISHVIGSRPSADATPSPRPRHRLHSPLPSTASSKESLTSSSTYLDVDPMQSYECSDNNRRSRVLSAIQRVESAREQQLVNARRVGRVLHAAPAPLAHRLRTLNFKWQRGLKIGAGTFGKVYTIVNTESGQLLAMKELSIAAADRRAFQRAANELQVLEGVIHPHLVRYYGCELHREEMLIFMELCVEGSLEALIATSGALHEPTARRYTKQLLSAVHALHARSIAHRDIKSGNIFLTNDGHCLKLGDFGCAVKIRANTTAPNELQGFVGTQAYMAPEVFMKSSGHGRAADIWSVGCVVTEMASGKRPFSEYDSNYQIMFMVGMGSKPAIPATLSAEGRHFCELCLTHDPELRPRADELMSHTFLMVKSDEDCKCEPAYLIT